MILFQCITIDPCIKHHVADVYWIDTVYVQNNLSKNLVKGQFS